MGILSRLRAAPATKESYKLTIVDKSDDGGSVNVTMPVAPDERTPRGLIAAARACEEVKFQEPKDTYETGTETVAVSGRKTRKITGEEFASSLEDEAFADLGHAAPPRRGGNRRGASAPPVGAAAPAGNGQS